MRGERGTGRGRRSCACSKRTWTRCHRRRRRRRALAAAAGVPVTGFSLADLVALATESNRPLGDVLATLRDAGLETIAELPIDLLEDVQGAAAAALDAGLAIPRVTVHRLASGDRLRIVQLAHDLQAAVGVIQLFAPLPRSGSAAQPSTG